MSQYIKRTDVLRIVNLHYGPCSGYNEIKNLPAEDVAPVMHGRWIQEYRIKEMRYSPDDIERYKVPDGFSCSICSKWNSAKTNYCPNCGAKMDGD